VAATFRIVGYSSAGWHNVSHERGAAGAWRVKPGLRSEVAGSWWRVALDTGHDRFVIRLEFLTSYEKYGAARLSCRAGCTCTPRILNASRPKERVSVSSVADVEVYKVQRATGAAETGAALHRATGAAEIAGAAEKMAKEVEETVAGREQLREQQLAEGSYDGAHDGGSCELELLVIQPAFKLSSLAVSADANKLNTKQGRGKESKRGNRVAADDDGRRAWAHAVWADADNMMRFNGMHRSWPAERHFNGVFGEAKPAWLKL